MNKKWTWKEWLGYVIFALGFMALMFGAMLYMTSEKNWYRGDYDYHQKMKQIQDNK